MEKWDSNSEESEDEKDLIADLAQAMDKSCEAAGIRLPARAPLPPQQQFQTFGGR